MPTDSWKATKCKNRRQNDSNQVWVNSELEGRCMTVKHKANRRKPFTPFWSTLQNKNNTQNGDFRKIVIWSDEFIRES